MGYNPYIMNIIVLAGGLSPERDVSLSSGSLIANALIQKGHRVFLLDPLVGSDTGFDGLAFLSRDSRERYSFEVPREEPDLAALRRKYPEPLGKNVIGICQRADVVFIALCGAAGENGQLQGLFDLHGIRYTGSGYLGCALAMDKDISKKLALLEKIPTAQWKTYSLSETGAEAIIARTETPCVVKPLSCGSSVGISIPGDRGSLAVALKAAEKYEATVLIEEKIEGREFSCGVLAGKALPLIEIKPKAGFYDYQNKYQKGLTDEICPAPIDGALSDRIRDYALRMHGALRLGYYSRSDFILRPTGEVMFLETNTLPGMTPTSLLPQEAAADGIPYDELCDLIAGNPVGRP